MILSMKDESMHIMFKSFRIQLAILIALEILYYLIYKVSQFAMIPHFPAMLICMGSFCYTMIVFWNSPADRSNRDHSRVLFGDEQESTPSQKKYMKRYSRGLAAFLIGLIAMAYVMGSYYFGFWY